MKKETDADAIDFNKKILHMSWHPFEDSIAIAATNNVSSSEGASSLQAIIDITIALRLFCVVNGKGHLSFNVGLAPS